MSETPAQSVPAPALPQQVQVTHVVEPKPPLMPRVKAVVKNSFKTVSTAVIAGAAGAVVVTALSKEDENEDEPSSSDDSTSTNTD